MEDKDEESRGQINMLILILAVVLAAVLLTACSNSMTLIHTEGSAQDLIDETSIPTLQLEPTL